MEFALHEISFLRLLQRISERDSFLVHNLTSATDSEVSWLMGPLHEKCNGPSRFLYFVAINRYIYKKELPQWLVGAVLEVYSRNLSLY